MTKHSWVLGVLLSFFLLIPSAIAAPDGTGIITTNGTNVSGSQSNVTVVDTNNTYSITAWNVGTGIKTFTIHVFNSSDTLYFNIYNNTPGMVYELRVNSSAINGYQADGLGLITFRYVQPIGNRSYDLRPATVLGGQNFSWSWFRDIIIKNGTIENVWMKNVTQINVNVTTLNATEITGNGSRINGINATNITFGEFLDHLLSGNVLLGSNGTLVRTSNSSLVLAQKVDSCTAANDALGWNNTGLNCKTISAGGGSVNTSSNLSKISNLTLVNGTLTNLTQGGTGQITINSIFTTVDYSTHFERNPTPLRLYDNFTNGSFESGNVEHLGYSHQILINSGILITSQSRFGTESSYILDSNPLIVNYLVNTSAGATSVSIRSLIGLNDSKYPIGFGVGYPKTNVTGFMRNNTGWYAYTNWNGTEKSDPITSGLISNNTLLTLYATNSSVKYFINGTQVATHTESISNEPLRVSVITFIQTGTITAPEIIWLDYLSIKKVFPMI